MYLSHFYSSTNFCNKKGDEKTRNIPRPPKVNWSIPKPPRPGRIDFSSIGGMIPDPGKLEKLRDLRTALSDLDLLYSTLVKFGNRRQGHENLTDDEKMEEYLSY